MGVRAHARAQWRVRVGTHTDAYLCERVLV